MGRQLQDAIVVLGVGKNMVRSIRYWCLATGLFEETRGGKGVSSLRLSQLATLLLADNGWDPYLEDIGTLWLLHWQLVTNVMMGVGAACFSGALEPSHVLLAIGLSRSEAGSTVRASLGRFTTVEDVGQAAFAITNVAKRLQKESQLL